MIEKEVQKFVEVVSNPRKLEPGKVRSVYYIPETSLILAFLIEVVGDAVHLKKAPEFTGKIGVAYHKEGPPKIEIIVPLGDGGLQYYIPGKKQDELLIFINDEKISKVVFENGVPVSYLVGCRPAEPGEFDIPSEEPPAIADKIFNRLARRFPH